MFEIKVGSLENGRDGVKKVKSGNSNKVGGPLLLGGSKPPLEIMDKNDQFAPADEHVKWESLFGRCWSLFLSNKNKSLFGP